MTTKSHILHFDSYASTYNNSQQYNTWKFNNNDPNSAVNSYNADYKLPFSLFNIRQIKLKSIEIPFTFNSVRENSNMNIFSYSADNITYKNIVLADENFSDVAVIITRLNSALVSQFPSDNMTFSLQSNNKIRLSSTTLTNVYVKDSLLAEQLGFYSTNNLMATNYNQATLPYLLNLDLYVMLYFPNISSLTKNVSGLNGHFKVPLNSLNGQFFYMAEGTSYIQTIDCNINILEKLTVCVLDRWGNSLSSMGSDLSFTLEFICS